MRILGIGTDIVECPRIGKMIEQHGELFLRRVYTEREIRYCQARRHALEHFAGRWAAKEAILKAIGTGWTTFPGRSAADLRSAIESGRSNHGGEFHGTRGQVGVFGRQLRKRAVDARDEVRGRVRRDGTGRDHGYPGGRARPPRYDPSLTDEVAR